MRWSPACAFVVAVGVIFPTSARGNPPPVSLELIWNAPAQCPGASFVVQRVEQLVRGHLLATPKVVATANIDSAPNGNLHLALTLESDGVEDTRTLEGPSCAALAEASAVVIALAIDPSSMDDRTPEAPEAERETAVVPPVPEPLPPKPAPASIDARAPASPRRLPSPRFAAGLGAASGLGALPSLGAGLVVSASLRIDRFRAGLLGTVWSRQTPMFSPNGGASFDMLEVGAFGSYMFPVGPIRLGPGVDVQATHTRVKGVGIRAPRSSSTLWPTAVAGVRGEAPFTRWLGLFARGDVLFPIGAPTFTLTTAGQSVELHEPSHVSLRMSVGVEIVVP